MAKLIKCHNKNTDRRTASLVGILMCFGVCIILIITGLWLFAAAAFIVGLIISLLLFKRFKVLQSGLDGENKTAKMLAKALPRSAVVMQNCTVKCGPTAEFDCIVIAPNGVTAVEVKNQAGEVTGSASAPFWHHIRSGKGGSVIQKQMPNALMQTQRQGAVLQNVLLQMGVKAPLRCCVYFSNNYITAKIAGGTVFTDEQKLLSFIQKGRDALPLKTVKLIANEIRAHSI